MPIKFWDEAFLCAAYLINMLPSKVIDHETPMERILRKTADYASLRVFGCACWPNLRPFNKRKLAFRSKQCVFLGYSHMHKGFKCLDVSSGRVYISRDVVFDETVFPFANLHPNASVLLSQKNLLLLEALVNPPVSSHEGAQQCTDLTPNDSIIPVLSGASQEQQCTGENFVQNRVETRENRANSGNMHVLGARHEANQP
jgi:histone deacetylase 1/2